jgi:hypothetical protein
MPAALPPLARALQCCTAQWSVRSNHKTVIQGTRGQQWSAVKLMRTCMPAVTSPQLAVMGHCSQGGPKHTAHPSTLEQHMHCTVNNVGIRKQNLTRHMYLKLRPMCGTRQ